MGYAKVPDHRRPLPSGSTITRRLSLSHTPFIFNTILCLVLLLLPFLAGAEPLYDTSNVLDGPIDFDIASINTTWEAGGYADIVIRVPLSSDTFPTQAATPLPPDSISMLLVPYRSRDNITLFADPDFTLVSRERVGSVGILRYRWPVPVCIRPGRHELQLRTRTSARSQPHTVPVFVVVSDDGRRTSCDSGLQVLLNALRMRHDHVQNHPSPQQALVAGGANVIPFATVTVDEIPADLSPAEIDIEPEAIRRREEGYGDDDDEDYDDPGDVHLPTSSGPPYDGPSYTPSVSYMSTASGNYSATATSLTPSETSTYVRNGTSSASGNGTSTIVVTSTATSVKTVTSVSTDIETMVTTVTGRDTTEIYTTTQTLVSTIVVPTTATGGLLPVNGAASATMLPLTVAATVCVATVFWLLCSMDCGVVW